MKVTKFDILRADAGWRIFSFLKIMTDEGLIGWSEFNESFGSAGLADVITALMPIVIGKDPRDIELINCHIRTHTVQARGGINRQAVAAIENALLDIKGKALGVPVYQLLGSCACATSAASSSSTSSTWTAPSIAPRCWRSCAARSRATARARR